MGQNLAHAQCCAVRMCILARNARAPARRVRNTWKNSRVSSGAGATCRSAELLQANVQAGSFSSITGEKNPLRKRASCLVLRALDASGSVFCLPRQKNMEALPSSIHPFIHSHALRVKWGFWNPSQLCWGEGGVTLWENPRASFNEIIASN